MYGITPSKDRELLQPIDMWMRRVAQHAPQGKKLSDKRYALSIVQHADKPERANQGAWYFCAKVAESSAYRVGRSLNDGKYLDRLVKQHIDCNATWSDVITRWRKTYGHTRQSHGETRQ